MTGALVCVMGPAANCCSILIVQSILESALSRGQANPGQASIFTMTLAIPHFWRCIRCQALRCGMASTHCPGPQHLRIIVRGVPV